MEHSMFYLQVGTISCKFFCHFGQKNMLAGDKHEQFIRSKSVYQNYGS